MGVGAGVRVVVQWVVDREDGSRCRSPCSSIHIYSGWWIGRMGVGAGRGDGRIMEELS